MVLCHVNASPNEDQLRDDLLGYYDVTNYPESTAVSTGLVYKKCPQLDRKSGLLISDVIDRFVNISLYFQFIEQSSIAVMLTVCAYVCIALLRRGFTPDEG